MARPAAILFLVITVVVLITTVTMINHPPYVANPGHTVARLLGTLEKGPLPLRPSAPNPGTYIPAAAMGSTLAPLLGSPEKGPLRPSAPNPATYIPPVVGPLFGSLEKGLVAPSAPNTKTSATTTSKSVIAPSSDSLKKASHARPPPAPNGAYP